MPPPPVILALVSLELFGLKTSLTVSDSRLQAINVSLGREYIWARASDLAAGATARNCARLFDQKPDDLLHFFANS